MIAGIVAPVVSVALQRVEGAHVAGVQSGSAAAAKSRAHAHAAARRAGAAGEAVVAVGQAATGAAKAVRLGRDAAPIATARGAAAA